MYTTLRDKSTPIWDHTVIKELTGGCGADIAVEIAGSADAVKSSIELVRNCGRIVLTGSGYAPLEIDMAGQVKTIIDRIIDQRGSGNKVLMNTTRTKLLLKGIDPEAFTESTEDDPAILDKIKAIAEEFGVKL